MLIIVENLQKTFFEKTKLVKNILKNVEKMFLKCWKSLKIVEKCWKMLNVENINKNVEMLKNVDTKINFFDTNNFLFR